MGRRPGTRGTQHIDKEKARKEREVMDAMRMAIDCGDEEGFLELVKQAKPNLTRAELLSVQNQFRSVLRNR
jgi:hypothetical protein